MKDVAEPFMVHAGDATICIIDENYVWIELYPDDETYAITIKYDDKDNLIEWYFDVAKEVGIENGIPYEDDLYLDLLILPGGSSMILDEDELEAALRNGFVTKEDYDLAYGTLHKLQSLYAENFRSLEELTTKIRNEFKS